MATTARKEIRLSGRRGRSRWPSPRDAARRAKPSRSRTPLEVSPETGSPLQGYTPTHLRPYYPPPERFHKEKGGAPLIFSRAEKPGLGNARYQRRTVVHQMTYLGSQKGRGQTG